ncbi:uncharacterized protein LOC133843574 [Drosophila sulfurigaster albostrigata]|uniref:uncharacterized protein LOC133843574 n=1 Tax=Drosophila sulfurigaster albostrigata TaxID=89887 RepID=UPI002D21EB0F|nr:uncharacterized protein LOC133843574 [Drosophila sulfurigaster albostrigata]
MGKQSNRQDFCKFNIQLLSDKSVVLVTATGFESEIFVPQLKNNRIALTNVVCSRQPKNQRSETRLSVRPNLIRSNRITNRRLITATAGLTPALAKASPLGLKFDIKLISNGNVVLVECNGYESEIFLPLISSRSVTMKRVSALELTRYAWQISFNENTEKGRGSAAVLAASLAAQAVGLTKLLVSPSDIVSSETSSSLIVKEKKKKNSKLLLKAAGDAKSKELAKYKSPSSAYKL